MQTMMETTNEKTATKTVQFKYTFTTTRLMGHFRELLINHFCNAPENILHIN